jgi:stage II sporulation protein GA (sporulation sigma-E factor processing peptidase)
MCTAMAIAMLFISVLIVYKPIKIPEMLFDTFCVTAVSFVVGGTALGIFYYINIGNNLSLSINGYFPLGILFTACSIVFVVVSFVKKIMQNNAVKKQVFCNIDIIYENKNVRIRALADTGNSLTEPISGKPIIITELCAVKNIIPKRLFRFANDKNKTTEDIFYLSKDDEYISRLSLVPFKSVGNNNGLLLCFTADKAEIDDITVHYPLVALCNISFSATGKYNAIINPKIFDMGGYSFEKNVCGAYGGRYEGV